MVNQGKKIRKSKSPKKRELKIQKMGAQPPPPPPPKKSKNKKTNLQNSPSEEDKRSDHKN